MDINYRVHVTPDRAFVKVLEKASYLNCEPIRNFFEEQNKRGCNRFVIDFQHCSSMDSTFLGILVGVALKVRNSADGGSFTLLNLRGRNLETVCNLGIHQIADISSDQVNNIEELLAFDEIDAVFSLWLFMTSKNDDQIVIPDHSG